jgi:hypothetical protein
LDFIFTISTQAGAETGDGAFRKEFPFKGLCLQGPFFMRRKLQKQQEKIK